MTQSKEIESLFQSFLQPYEEQINKLQKEQKEKDIEICTLKHAIYNLSQIITNLQKENSNKLKLPQIGNQPGKKEEEKKSPAAKRPNTSHPYLKPPTKKDEKSMSLIFKTPISDKHSFNEEKEDPETISHKSDDKKNNKKLGKNPAISPKVKAIEKKKDTKIADSKKKEGKDTQKDKNLKPDEKKEEKKLTDKEEKKEKEEKQQNNDDEQEDIL